ncbi:glycosyltransferase family 2 protein [Cecembia rubra]|uniref:Glycosyl transferase family 2 n=1 Tax=Cecembia rubra TaxID=1485585 RepID=A0A2P8EA21_9BACT|nr:glycosyltransferase family A protein [Cecembia rubra]PSL06309.1 glycosyl transferase family 2 [Cecembia rubra]
MKPDSSLPLFTVIIPQKDRAEYLKHTLRTCMVQDYPNFEIIVSDDCSNDDSVELVEKLIKQDSRITLYAHKNHLGMRENFEFALSKVKPGYVMALGGDDALVPGCIWRMFEILSGTNRKLLTWIPAGFTYPDHDNGKNIFYIKRSKNKDIQFIRSNDFLNKLSKTFQYQIDECPMLFMKAVVSTDLIEIVKSRTPDNSFYYCATPDGFSGVVLAGEVEDYAFTNEPLSIGGSTVKSQGRNYQRSDERSRKESEQFFKDNNQKLMHAELASQPYSPLVTLMTADYLLTARDLPGWPGKFEAISFENLIRASFNLIQIGSFENKVLVRELRILREIAKYHGLEDLFNSLLKSTLKKVKPKDEIYGFLLTNSIRFEGSELGINNIYDASLVTNFVFKFYSSLSGRFLINWIKNSSKLILANLSQKKEKLPEI